MLRARISPMTSNTPFHAGIREHLEPFLREVADRGDGHGLPPFVGQVPRVPHVRGVEPWRCTRFRCTNCTLDTLERLAPFCCKRRGVCLRCRGRRMAECAASLVDTVLPRVPNRQRLKEL